MWFETWVVLEITTGSIFSFFLSVVCNMYSRFYALWSMRATLQQARLISETVARSGGQPMSLTYRTLMQRFYRMAQPHEVLKTFPAPLKLFLFPFSDF